MKIYLTRHGQTFWNIEKRLQGSKNSDLTEQGIRQAELLCERMKSLTIDAIYSSPLERAYKTANIIKGHRDLGVITNEGLREIGLGDWEGFTVDEIDANPLYTDELKNYFENPEHYKPFGGETLLEVSNRSHKVLDYIIEKHKDKDEHILVVTHGVTLKTLIGYLNKKLTQLEVMQLPVYGQTSITEVDFDGEEFIILKQNDISHYGDNFEIKGW